MKIPGRPRLTLLAAMTLVAMAAGLLGWIAAERRARLAAVLAEYRRAEAKFLWAERMQRKGYIPGSQVASQKAVLGRARSELQDLGATPDGP